MEWTKRMISNGISTYCSDHITIKGLTLDLGDDCVSFKPNSTNIVVEDTICGGSHGVSVGALLNTPVSTISLRTFTSAMSASSIDQIERTRKMAFGSKLGPVGSTDTEKVYNVTYQDIKISNVDSPIVVDTCYSNSESVSTPHSSIQYLHKIILRFEPISRGDDRGLLQEH